jgi:hypothetical protein
VTVHPEPQPIQLFGPVVLLVLIASAAVAAVLFIRFRRARAHRARGLDHHERRAAGAPESRDPTP